MAKKKPTPQPVEDPSPWCIEIEFFDARKSEMYAIMWMQIDSAEIKFETLSGDVMIYGFGMVSKVLSMHSVLYDYAQAEGTG